MRYSALMYKFGPAFFFIIALLATGCAWVQVPIEGVFPCRMQFDGMAAIKGENMPIAGAAQINSASAGLAQVYGPGGLAAFTIDMQDGEVKIMDMWGRQVRSYTIPLKECIGLLAGVPLEHSYLFRRRVEQGFEIIYPWGTLLLDQGLCPREMHVTSGLAIDLSFASEPQGIHLLMEHGSDKVDLQIHILEGGRWGACSK